jgi:hypothetical protein
MNYPSRYNHLCNSKELPAHLGNASTIPDAPYGRPTRKTTTYRQTCSCFAAYDSVISVGAVNCNSTIAPFSQQNEQVELVAPGQNVRSAIMPWVPPLVAFNITTTRGTVLRGFNFQPVRDSGLGDIRGEVRNCGSMTRACPSASGKVCLAWRGGNSFR